MQTMDKEAPTTGPLSYSEETAWRELTTDPGLFFRRGAVLSADLPPGAGRAEARKLLSAVADRHAIFRTAFDTVAGQPVRHVLDRYEHKIMEADAAVYPLIGDSTTELTPDDLARVWLTPGPDGRKQLSMDINEMITDSWSCARLHTELNLLNGSWDGPQAVPGLDGPAATYAEYAREQRVQQLPAELVEYWRTQLANLGPADYITQDGPDPSGDAAGERVVIFSDDMTESLRGLCRTLRLSPFMAAVGLVTMVTAARSGARDILLATTTLGRARRWTNVQGNFSNVTPLRTVLPPNPSFADVLGLSRATVLGALRHREMPFLQLPDILDGRVVEARVRVHYLAHQAHHYRMLDTRPSGDAWIEDAVFAGWPMEIGFAEDKRGRFAIWMSYDPRIHRHTSAGRLLEDCCDVLRRACSDPDLTCRDLAGQLDRAG